MTLFLIAQIAGRRVAIDTAQIDSVLDLGEVVAVPAAPPSVRGLAALRSRVVTVIDTGAALGLAPTAPGTRRAVITRVDGHPYAILVEAMDDVVPLEPMALSPGLTLDRGWARVGVGLVEQDCVPLLIVDLATLVPTVALAA